MAKTRRKKKSQAPVALVYFVTLIFCMALVGGIAYYLLDRYGVINNQAEEGETTTLKCINTLYARVNSKGVLCDLAVLRVDPNRQQIIIVPAAGLTKVKDSSQTFREVMTDGGVTKLETAVENTYGISVDNYVTITNKAFEKVVDIFGGMSYTAEQELYYLSQDTDNDDVSIAKGEIVSLSGHQVRLITQYPIFAEGRMGNLTFLSDALEQTINNGFRQASITRDNLSNIYKIITENSDTNVSTDDFTIIKSYMKTMLDSSIIPAYSLKPEGEWDSEEKFFTPSEDYLSNVVSVLDGETNVTELVKQAAVGEAADDSALAAQNTTTTAEASQTADKSESDGE